MNLFISCLIGLAVCLVGILVPHGIAWFFGATIPAEIAGNLGALAGGGGVLLGAMFYQVKKG